MQVDVIPSFNIMPVRVVRRKGSKRPWKIVEKSTGRIVGSSTNKRKAQSSARVRNAASGGANMKKVLSRNRRKQK